MMFQPKTQSGWQVRSMYWLPRPYCLLRLFFPAARAAPRAFDCAVLRRASACTFAPTFCVPPPPPRPRAWPLRHALECF